MTPQEAQFILAAVHPDPSAETDPKVMEALRIVESQPALRDWHAREQAFDRAMTHHVRSVAPPEGLRARILAGQRASRSARNPLRAWTPARLVLAASVVALLVATVYLRVGPWSPPDRLASAMVRFVDEEWDHRFDRSGSEYAEHRGWLAAQAVPISLEVPEALAINPTFGCRIFSWHGHIATLVCFRVTELGTVVHVISLPLEALPGFDETRPRLASVGTWSTATWRRGERIYLAVTTAPADALTRLL